MKIIIKRYHIRHALLFLHLLIGLPQVSYSQSQEFTDEEYIPVPEAAYDIRRYSLESESAYQIDFNFNAVYPDTKIASYYADLFIKKGWSVCDGDNKWIDYSKRIRNETGNVLIRQKLLYIASSKERKLTLVALRYFEDQKLDTKQSQKLNNDVQYVTVVLYDLGNKNYKKTLNLLSLSCEE